jgi:broad specificity phosphatase PhoE
MRTLEVHRHTMRRKPGEHLSQDGILLARLVGSTSGPFSLVVTSAILRAVETAIAMGFEVNQTLDALGHFSDALREVGWPNSFARVAQAVAMGGSVGKFAEEQARLWRSVVEQIPDSQQALIITHGGFVELGAVATMPESNHGAWGDAIGFCEGVRLTFDGDCRSCEILRVPEEYHLVEN